MNAFAAESCKEYRHSVQQRRQNTAFQPRQFNVFKGDEEQTRIVKDSNTEISDDPHKACLMIKK